LVQRTTRDINVISAWRGAKLEVVRLDDTNPLLTAAATKANLALQRAAAGITPDRAPAIEALRTAIRPS
jgi:hypothetical protein